MSISLNVLPCCFVMSSINLSILSVTEINLSDSKPIVRIISNLYDLVLKCFICLVPLPQVIYALNQYLPMMQLWVELFLRIDLQQKEKEESGKYLDKNWIKAKERSLMK